MDFYDREKEIAFLRGERERSAKGARLTVVSGRRRVGKTQLVRRAINRIHVQKPPVAFVMYCKSPRRPAAAGHSKSNSIADWV